MQEAIVRVLKLLAELSPSELQFVIVKARELGGVSRETERWRKHKNSVGANADNPLAQTELDNVVSTASSTNGNCSKEALEVLQFLNAKTGKNFRAVGTNLDLIRGRLQEGNSLEDCRGVVARQYREWSGTEMAKYLRPATLFNRVKFEQYLGEKRSES